MLRLIIVTLALTFLPLQAAVSAETRLPAAEEERARKLFLQLRCVVCQNQSIGDSDADVARDLREIVREQISAGKTNAEISGFLVDRYGEFILLKPVFAWHTAALWGAPIVLLLIGGLLAWRVSTRRPRADEKIQLSRAEQDALEKLLDQHKL